MTKDILGRTKIRLPDGTEQDDNENLKDRPRWPYSNNKKGSCPFSLIYKKWVVHPDDTSKHPSYINPATYHQTLRSWRKNLKRPRFWTTHFLRRKVLVSTICPSSEESTTIHWTIICWTPKTLSTFSKRGSPAGPSFTMRTKWCMEITSRETILENYAK